MAIVVWRFWWEVRAAAVCEFWRRLREPD